MHVSEYIELISKRNQNTYKYALGYVLAELNPEKNIIPFQVIADKIIDFYYMRAVLPKLSHTNNPAQKQKVITTIEEVIQEEGLLEDVDVIPEKIKKKIVKKIVREKNNGFFKYVLPCWEGARKNSSEKYIYPEVGENNCFWYSLVSEEIVLKEDFKSLINYNSELLKKMVLQVLEEKLRRFN